MGLRAGSRDVEGIDRGTETGLRPSLDPGDLGTILRAPTPESLCRSRLRLITTSDGKGVRSRSDTGGTRDTSEARPVVAHGLLVSGRVVTVTGRPPTPTRRPSGPVGETVRLVHTLR